MNMKKLIITAFLLMALANVSYGQGVICSPRTLIGGPDIVAQGVCPTGYTQVGTTNSSSNRGRGSASAPIFQDMINRNEADRQARLAREAAAAEAQRQRNYEAQQAAERVRRQAIRNSSLPESARCLAGAWLNQKCKSAIDFHPKLFNMQCGFTIVSI
jgi:hypothetical protein